MTTDVSVPETLRPALAKAYEIADAYLARTLRLTDYIGEYSRPYSSVKHRIKQELRKREAQYRGVFEATTDALLVAGADGQIIGANQAAEQLFDTRRDKLDETTVDALLNLPVEFADLDQEVSEGNTVQHETKFDRHDQSLHLEVRGSSYETMSEHHVLLSIRDITHQKQMQEQLYRADRLASLGTMAAGVAHEINNPLSYIINNLEVVLWELDSDDPLDADDIKDAISRAKSGAECVERTVRDLTNFSHGGLDESVQPVDIRRMIDLAVQMVQNTIDDKGAELVVDHGATSRVLANETRLNQVFVNILLNAAQALPDAEDQPKRIELSTRNARDNHVVVTISDTGEGIADNIRNRIFDPFFTTKAVDEGTGIGLSICHEIIQAIGGNISLETAVGEGTTFEILLPTPPR